MKRASKDTLAGRRYLDLQRQAKRSGRPTDELIQLYALECFLDRLVHSEFADTFILKGGVLLAALDARRPTRDIDFAVRVFENSAEKFLSAVRTIAAIPLDDGMTFDSSGAAAEAIREEDSYSGIRVTLEGTLSRAVVRFHVDVTRWRDFVDIYVLTRHYQIDAQTLHSSMQRVAQFRNVALILLRTALVGYADIAQSRWVVWLRKQRLNNSIPTGFSIVLQSAVSFADWMIERRGASNTWDPAEGKWIGVRG